jgi:S-adenosylmethionine decarboxylase
MLLSYYNQVLEIFTIIYNRIYACFIPLKHHGNHVFADFIWNPNDKKVDDIQVAETVFKIITEAVQRTSMTIVHKKLCILGQGNSPPGFTSIILIDESHVSSHCYSDKGWLAVDCFTCGSTNPVGIMQYISTEIKKEYPTFECTYFKHHKRFHYR